MATITWRLVTDPTKPIGATFESLDLENPLLTFQNRASDTLTFDEPADTDSGARFGRGLEVAVTKQVDSAAPVCIFRGHIRQVPRSGAQGAERVRYLAYGAWEQLERRAYLQSFKMANDPSNPTSTLNDVDRGQVILGQNVLGTKINMEAALIDILNYAIAGAPPTAPGVALAVGTITLPRNIIWDEATDLSCADAINRILQLAPDAVGWFDYSFNPPKFNCMGRPDLAAVSFAVHPAASADGAYAPLETIEINPRYDLLVANVAIIYLATNRANASSWKVVTPDVYPAGTTGREDACLVRTVELAGSSYDDTILDQHVVTAELNSSLEVAPDKQVSAISDGFAYDALVAFWKQHYPKFTDPTWAIKSFTNGRRLKADGTDPDTDCDRELTGGAITDWMVSGQSIKAEEQAVFCDIEVEITDPIDPSKVTTQVIHASASIMATNADQALYTCVASFILTPPEEIPTGIALDLYNALSVVQYDGELKLGEDEASGLVSVGQKLNLTGSLAEWATMNAVVQQVTVQLSNGRTAVTIGPAAHLGPDDLVECFRQNRNRPPVTSYYERTTGQNGSQQQRQGLTLYSPIKPGTPAMVATSSVYDGDIT